ncbi:hypothetical protein ADK70_09750 [Streptomyces rimosus subsp. pseudoverticillatus]|uniref:hypothetical protein n=1 Tax=Streptomyces rimosus TaxID=1927 RepID=UPI0006B2936A|nr:hypothetical protein [Streptomyces rimosus]KOT96165.1 hypothetical protein ADK70_09750 [Streptomyces rimosus subsp. pseudoverticillatus]
MDCLFCGENRKMTKEHILPRWMREEFPELAKEPVYSGSRFEYDSPAGNGPKERIEGGRKQGGPFTNQAPVVCGSCNGGWMSGLETAVRKPLVQMIKGLPVTLTAEQSEDGGAMVGDEADACLLRQALRRQAATAGGHRDRGPAGSLPE